MKQGAVLICGDRHYDDYEVISLFVLNLPVGTVVVQGDAPGADTMARMAAEDHHKPHIDIPYFGFMGRAGGPARNNLMLKVLMGLAKMGFDWIEVHAFHHNIAESKGTKNMVSQARKAGVKVVVHS